MAVEVYMPKMSDHMEVGEVIRWLAQEGEAVEEHQPLLEVMTDKVVAVYDAPASGILKGIRAGAQEGAKVPVGETIAFIAGPDEVVPILPPLGPAEGQAPAVGPAMAPAPAEASKVRAAPAARTLAKELGIDLSLVAGTGPEGRIKVEDVRAFHSARQARNAPVTPVARRMAQELGVDLARAVGTGPGRRVVKEDIEALAGAATLAAPMPEGDTWLDLTPIQRITGQRMLESSQNIPQFVLSANADATNLLWLREALLERIQVETGERLSLTALLVKVVAAALKNYPRANASFAQGRICLHAHVNVGVAVGTESGLVVPVIKDADRKLLAQVVRELASFADKARAMRFSADDLSGGTFTLSNLGMHGVDRFAALINPPESAILAVGRIVKTPVGMPDDTIALRPLVNLTLSIDHRSLDGLQGAKLLAEIKARLEKPYFLL